MYLDCTSRHIDFPSTTLHLHVHDDVHDDEDDHAYDDVEDVTNRERAPVSGRLRAAQDLFRPQRQQQLRQLEAELFRIGTAQPLA
jgi:hypothetical protein